MGEVSEWDGADMGVARCFSGRRIRTSGSSRSISPTAMRLRRRGETCGGIAASATLGFGKAWLIRLHGDSGFDELDGQWGWLAGETQS